MPISKRNRRGLIWLLLIGLVVVYSPRISSMLGDTQTYSFSFEEAIELENEITTAKENKSNKDYKKKERKYNLPKESFNPNEYILDDWINLGLSEKQAEVILKFTSRKIYSNNELEKIFVLPNELYNLIKDSTFYPSRVDSFKTKVEEDILVVDLNNSNQEELETIPGIGPFYASKIIEHREKLGGFVNEQQLLEIWKFDTEKLRIIQPYIQISNKGLTPLNINTSTLDELKNHPYISYAIANSIVKMRIQSGDYVKVEEIKRSKLIDEELFLKIQPYLIVKK